MNERPELLPHQVEGIADLSRRTRALHVGDTGVGKTRQALEAAVHLGWPVIVVCPASVQENWCREVHKWTSLRTAKVTRKNFRWPKPHEVVVTRWSNLPIPQDKEAQEHYEFFPAIYPEGVPPQLVVILDECQQASNMDSKRYRSVDALIKAAPKEPNLRLWGLSATPLQNKPDGLWNILQLLGLQKEIGGIWQYMSSIETDEDDKAISFTEEGKANLARVMIRQRASEIGVMPELKPPVTLWVPLEDGEVKDTLNHLVKQAGGEDYVRAVMLEAKKSKERLEIESCLAQGRKLLADVKMPKLLAALDRLNRSNYPALVFAIHKKTINMLKARERSGGFTGDDSLMYRQRMVDMFQDGKIDVLGFTSAGSTGINLSRAQFMIRVDLCWNASDNRQIVGRMLRMDSPHDECYVFDIRADHFIDTIVHEANERKAALMESGGL